MSLDAYLTRLPVDDATAETCDHCGRPRVNQLDPLACQCPDDEAPECAAGHEDAAAEGSDYCHECNRITRDAIRYAESAAKTAEATGDTVRAQCIRETAAEWRAA